MRLVGTKEPRLPRIRIQPRCGIATEPRYDRLAFRDTPSGLHHPPAALPLHLPIRVLAEPEAVGAVADQPLGFVEASRGDVVAAKADENPLFESERIDGSKGFRRNR